MNEWQQPLADILDTCDLLLNEADGKLSEQQTTLINVLRKIAHQMNETSQINFDAFQESQDRLTFLSHMRFDLYGNVGSALNGTSILLEESENKADPLTESQLAQVKHLQTLYAQMEDYVNTINKELEQITGRDQTTF
jgi:hypothetical protein